jgi:hypothetical protein
MSARVPQEVEAYLSRLGAELRKRGVPDARFLEETRGHLSDAIDDGVGRGLTPEAASDEALLRFGDAHMVAAKFAAGRDRVLHGILLGLALALGLAIAWIDSRPHWDDSGITAGLLLLTAGLLGLIGPRRAWLWALAIGLWVPLNLVIEKPSRGNILGGFVILAIPMLGAYAGMAVRRLMARSIDQQA